MFREPNRKNSVLSPQECIEILTGEKRGVLSVQGDESYPYGMPMNHFFCSEDGCIYFHCGPEGHRLDSLRRSSKVSFCTFDSGTSEDGGWALTVKSVIVFGRIETVDDDTVKIEITTRLSRKFTQNEEYIKKEIAAALHRTVLLRLVPEHICGRRVVEA